jgi:hypothetical protein
MEVMMKTVADLIQYLETLPQDMPVAYRCFSEQCLLDFEDIEIKDLCVHRDDGWIQNKRPDMPTMKYLVFPGN